MKKRSIYAFLIVSALFLARTESFGQAPVNPVSVDTWILNFGVGPGTNYWNNGYGFGPGFKVAFEKGMWKAGPGVFTLGGEMGFSYFGRKWDLGNYNLKEHWVNVMFGARSAYHMGFDVPGLDVYGGIPLGFGFSGYSYSGYTGPEDWKEWRGYTHHPVYPYLGVFIGGSYWFNSQLGVNCELGYNATFAQVGMVFKLN